MNLNIPLVYTCGTCGADCNEDSVDLLKRIRRNRHQVCQGCEDRAWVAVVGLVVDVNHALDMAALDAPDPIVNAYTRTTDTCIVRESPVDTVAYQRWIMLLIGLLTIAVSVGVAVMIWRGL